MGDVEKLKKQNKQLKALLKNAVQLLSRYKDLLQRAAPQAAKRKKAVKKTAAKKSRAKKSHAAGPPPRAASL